MDINHGEENKNKLKLINELISNFHQFFIEQEENIESLSSNIHNLKKEFKKKYELYVNIERFAIPVIGRISAGKSTFLSYLLGLRDIKGYEETSTTQIVCIIRHNKSCQNPKAYPVKFIERKFEDYQNNNLMKKYNFHKDGSNELNSDTNSIENIIKERNQYIKNNKKEKLTKEDFFIIIEMNIPIFNGELEKYSEIFEFMDLPGLNDTEEIQVFFKDNILPIIIPNIIFSFFIFDSSKFYVNDTFKVYDNFLKKLNGIDNNKNFDEYYDEIILGKENNFYILNKIDVEHNSSIKDDLINKFKIVVEKNYIQETNSKHLINETEKNKNFNSYLDFKIDNSENKDFTRYIKSEMKKDFNLKSLDTNNEITVNQNEENEIKSYLQEKETILNSKNFTNSLDIKTYLNLREIYNTYKSNLNLNKENFFYHKLLEACQNSFDSFCNLENYKKEYEDLIQKITSVKEDNNILLQSIRFNADIIKNEREKIKDFIDELEKLDGGDLIKDILEEYNKVNEFIDKDNKIRLAFLGTTSTGKSTILNNLIGQKILPTGPGICTKKGIIIQNVNNNIPKLYNAKFKEKNNYFIFEEDKEPICEGFEKIKTKLEEINKSNKEFIFEDTFIILKIKIELLDCIDLDNNLKNKIELIDFPGFGTNTLNENKIFGPLIGIISGFIFINKDDSIKEDSNEEIIQKIINFIKWRKYNIDLESSCLFILNNFSNIPLDINESKGKILQIIKNKFIDNSDFWRFNKNNENINVIEIYGKIFENFIEKKNDLTDFDKFIEMNIEELKDYNEDEKEKNILKEYIEDNYYKDFDNPSLEDKETANFYIKLCEKLNLDSNEGFSRREELLCICKKYEWMSKNIYKHKFFKKSHADIFVKNLVKNIKQLFTQISENVFKTFEKQLNQFFKMIDKGFKGNLLSKKFEKGKFHQNINSTYKKYVKEILNKIETEYKENNEKMDNYVINIDSDSNFDPIQEGKTLVDNLKNNWNKLIQTIEKDFNNYKKELKEIGREITDLLGDDVIDDNINVNYNDSFLLNFKSISHLKQHLLLFVPSIFLCIIPFGFLATIGLHTALATSNLVKDLKKKNETLKNHMIEFKFNLADFYLDFRKKIKRNFKTQKEQLQKNLELIVNLDKKFNDKKFNKENKEKFQSIYNNFRNLFINK